MGSLKTVKLENPLDNFLKKAMYVGNKSKTITMKILKFFIHFSSHEAKSPFVEQHIFSHLAVL